MKLTPAAMSPERPARLYPMWMAISVEFGPGIMLVAGEKVEKLRRREPFSFDYAFGVHVGDVDCGPAEGRGAKPEKKPHKLTA